MAKKKVKKKIAKNTHNMSFRGCNGSGGCAYFLGFIGAAVYYIQTATSFGNGAFGILKALVWPAILIYKALAFLG